jgi:Ser/Thr protein kinase RdoA (MazF antagonist)
MNIYNQEAIMRYGLINSDKDVIGFPAQSSVLDEVALFNRIIKEYDIPRPKDCRFLSRGDADIYRIRTQDQNFYLKVYRPPHTILLAEDEARFVNDLAQNGIPVIKAVARFDGTFASEVIATEGHRPMLLFEQAPPPLPAQVDNLLCKKLGKAVAKLHETTDKLSTGYSFPKVTGGSDLVRLLPFTKQFLSKEDYAFLKDMVLIINQRIKDLPLEIPDWGLCHSDLVLSNFRYDNNQVTFFDFAGASYTWRAFDLTIVFWSLGHRNKEKQGELWNAFLSGYESVREIPADTQKLLPVFLVLRHILFLSGNCATLPLRLGTEPFETDFITKGMKFIRNIVDDNPDLLT